MFGLGAGELILILLIVLVIFGANRLPELGNSIGKGIINFKKAIKDQGNDEAKSPDEKDNT